MHAAAQCSQLTERNAAVGATSRAAQMEWAKVSVARMRSARYLSRRALIAGRHSMGCLNSRTFQEAIPRATHVVHARCVCTTRCA